MTLIKSISGIRGTIGGVPGESLTPVDIVKFSAAFGQWILNQTGKDKNKIVLGRDARISGKMVQNLVASSLVGMGIDVIDVGLATTPTVEIAVTEEGADGGIILTASHNPKQWNALKLLNSNGEFISAQNGKELLAFAENNRFTFADVDNLGTFKEEPKYNKIHINKILQLNLVDIKAIEEANLTIAIDCVNSVGGIIIPDLLQSLGVKTVIRLYCEPTGYFPHNPEPLPEHLEEISHTVVTNNADLGFVVDPDVDRLAIINEDGSMFGEEYTLVAVADYVLKNNPGNTVSNLSSSRALKEITEGYGKQYSAAAVGEVNVVAEMKKRNAIIGGEGNGGVIYPELHFGRDALVGIALFLTHLAKSGRQCSELRKSYPHYVISKNKIELSQEIDAGTILERIVSKFSKYKINKIDGVKIEFENEWVHLRKSNTEPIIRVYAESNSEVNANKLAQSIIEEIKNELN